MFTTPLVIASISAVFFCAAFFYLLISNSNKKNAAAGETEINYSEELLRTMIEIHEQTFINIRQQIHDSIGQTLSLAKLNLNTSADNFTSEKMILTEELLGKAITELRDISKSLYSENIAARDLVKSIQSEMNTIAKITSLHTKFIIPPYAPILSEEQTIFLVRAAQALLNSIVRYAKAGKIIAEVILSADHLTITINDNGELPYYKMNETKTIIQALHRRLQLIGAAAVFDTKTETGNFAKIDLTVPGNV